MATLDEVGSDTAFELLAHLRNVGPYEEWLARPRGASLKGLPPLLVARRAHPSRPDPAPLAFRLGLATEIAQRVEHQNVVHCFGRLATRDLTAQLLEALEGTDLASALKRSSAVATQSAVWIARQIAEAVAHAHSLGQAHGGLAPEHVVVTRAGVVKVDFGLAAQHTGTIEGALTRWIDLRYVEPFWLADADQHPRLDAFAIAAILWELITGRVFTEARDEARAGYVRTERAPASLEAVLMRALDRPQGGGFANARALGDALSRIFYADLEGDDERDGRRALAAWITKVASAESELFARHRGSRDSARTTIQRDKFEEVLAERDAPVRPSELTREDVELGSTRGGEDGSWSPGMELRTRLELFRAEAPTSAEGTPALAAPKPASERAGRRKKSPSKLLWFWAGFAVTFSLLLLLSALLAANEPPFDRKKGGREKPVEVPRPRS